MIARGSIGSAINLIVTIATERAPGMTMRLVPLFVWMTLVTSIMIVFALPALAASLVMLLSDRLLHARFFDAAQGGAPLLWQHYFWIFGHPEVYIVVLPAFGMISEIIPVFSRKPIFGYPFVATSTVAIAFLSYGVWVHHMFAVALGRNFLAVFAAASMLIAVPTGMKIFSWIATMWGGAIRFTTAMLFAVAFLLEFTVGGLSGVAFATVPVDWQMTDTYFVVAHIHYVLFGGTVFALLAGVHYWFPKMSGRMLDEKLGRWSFWLIVLGFNTAFFVQHFLGLLGMRRRVYTYPDLPWFGALNIISTIGAAILVFGILLFCANIAMSLFFGAEAGDDPWNAWTLEWAAASPPLPQNFARDSDSAQPTAALGSEASGSAGLDDEPALRRRMQRAQLGMAMFLIAEAVFFFLLILAFVYFPRTRPQSLHVRTVRCTRRCSSRAVLACGARASGSRLWLGDDDCAGSRVSCPASDRVSAPDSRWRYHRPRSLRNNILHLDGASMGCMSALGLVALAVVPSTALRTMALYWYFFAGVWLVIFLAAYVWGAA